jgi:hypothetical protein
VTNWNRIATDTLVALPGAAGGAPPALQINMGMTQGAVYDAINAITPKHHRPYLLKRRFAATASKNAAVATASYRALSHIVATVPATIPFPNRASLLQSLQTEYAASLAALSGTPFKAQGIAAGNAAAEAMIAARQDDGRFGPSPWVPNHDPGHWQPLLNPDGMQMLDPTPWVGGVKPFLMHSSSQFRTAGPQALGSSAYAADVNEVKALGSVNSTIRTPEQTHIAIFWQSAGGPALTWNRVARDLVEDPTYAVDVGGSARLFAMLNLSGADTAINCLERQVPLGLLAPVAGDPTCARGWQPRDRPRPDMDGAHHGAVPRAPLWAPLSRRSAPPRAADVLRHRRDRVRRNEQPLPR